MSKLAKKIFAHQNDDEWFWNLGKRGYKNMLMQLTTEDKVMQIKKYGDKAVLAFLVG